MMVGHPQICLFQPEIPQNVGNIGRLCAATQSRLHLIRPIVFSMDDRNLLRPGLDYWPYLDLEIHNDIGALLQGFGSRVAFFSKKATKLYTAIPDDTSLFIFGQETKGLPDYLFEAYADQFYRLPIFHPQVRSLNVANAVAIVLYERLRRMGAGEEKNLEENS
jgi:tRNA (cytidine/uridine-2'-O-)-methyltransferase